MGGGVKFFWCADFEIIKCLYFAYKFETASAIVIHGCPQARSRSWMFFSRTIQLDLAYYTDYTFASCGVTLSLFDCSTIMEFTALVVDVVGDIDTTFYTYQTVVKNSALITTDDSAGSIFERTLEAAGPRVLFSRKTWEHILKHASLPSSFRQETLKALLVEGVIHGGDLTPVQDNYAACLTQWTTTLPLIVNMLKMTTGFTRCPSTLMETTCAIVPTQQRWTELVAFMSSSSSIVFEAFLQQHQAPVMDISLCISQLDEMYVSGANRIFRDLRFLGTALRATRLSGSDTIADKCIALYIRSATSAYSSTFELSKDEEIAYAIGKVAGLHKNVQEVALGLTLLVLVPGVNDICVTGSFPPSIQRPAKRALPMLTQSNKRFKATIERKLNPDTWSVEETIHDLIMRHQLVLTPLFSYGPLLQLFDRDTSSLSLYVPGTVSTSFYHAFDDVLPGLFAGQLPVYVKLRQRSVMVYFGTMQFYERHVEKFKVDTFLKEMPDLSNGKWTVFEVKETDTSIPWLEHAVNISMRVSAMNKQPVHANASDALTHLLHCFSALLTGDSLEPFIFLSHVLDTPATELCSRFNGLVDNILLTLE